MYVYACTRGGSRIFEKGGGSRLGLQARKGGGGSDGGPIVGPNVKKPTSWHKRGGSRPSGPPPPGSAHDVHTYIRTYVPPHTGYIHTSIHPTIHQFTNPCIHAPIYTGIHAYTRIRTPPLHRYVHRCTYTHTGLHTCI